MPRRVRVRVKVRERKEGLAMEGRWKKECLLGHGRGLRFRWWEIELATGGVEERVTCEVFGTKVKKYGLPLLLTEDEGVKSFIANVTAQFSEWLEAGKLQRVVLVEKGVSREKSDKEIMRETQARHKPL